MVSMEADETRAVACVASTHSERQQGGLTTLISELTRATVEHFEWSWLTRLDQPSGGATDFSVSTAEIRRPGPTYDLRTVRARTTRPGLLNAVARASHHSGGDRLAPLVYGLLIGPSLRRQVPERAALVHWVGTGLELLGFALRREAARRRIPFTVCPALHSGTWGDGDVDARLYRTADLVLALSRHERTRLVELGVEPERIVTVPLGPTLVAGGHGGRFRRLHGLADRPLVVFLGRRSRAKGLHVVVEAVQTLRGRGVDAALVIAGPSGDLIVSSTAGEGIIDLGLCDELAKADLLAAADVLCVPSSAESFGIVYVDAWSVGVPVIASHPPAVRELIDDGVDGFCVDQDRDAVADRLGLLFADGDLRRRMGEAGRSKQSRSYTWSRSAEEHELAFRRAASRMREEMYPGA